ncbi:organelle RRM domain-containing protein 1, chloroplastic-like isoform X3 [Carya illinoinensis]|uniref:organelle RRM domain-containing protein 1, chloroplastic-like isoform X3 n=1 Tax=Carya illinoinensis TaxID=32201 RepID=UPI001C727302|nr:organelle RRM domain-containing protein 1, chloroplastic-like isoform X3 [Carya illinoinensis]
MRRCIYIMLLVIPPLAFAVTLTKILPARSPVYLKFYRLGTTRIILPLKRHIAHLQEVLFPVGNTNHWLVRMDKPGVGVVTKAQMVDYYAQALTKVFGNEKHAQMCIYQISWRSNFRFCCDLDDEIAWELAGVLGVLSVLPDKNFESKNKDYGGLSFYTSEKTLRTASEGFGELVEVNIIVDKISKRSKGYAFIEYATEEAASTALRDEWQG